MKSIHFTRRLARAASAATLSLSLIAGLGLVPAGRAGAAKQDDRPFGDVKVLATFPTPPGYPEGIAVKGNKFYVSGPARFGTAGHGPSKVVAFNRDTGALEATYDTQGEALAFEHANSCIAFDGNGKLYVLNTQLGMYRLDTGSGAQESYSTPFPDLPACDGNNAPCSPTSFDLPALPNDIAFDEDGSAYVTDSLQATIWRVPAGGGTPQIYFQDARPGTARRVRASSTRCRSWRRRRRPTSRSSRRSRRPTCPTASPSASPATSTSPTRRRGFPASSSSGRTAR